MTNKKILKRAAALLLSAAMITGALIGLQTSTAAPVQTAIPIYRDIGHYSFAERAADMTARMTTLQKAQQLESSRTIPIAPGDDAAGSIGTGVRIYSWWNEALHGYSSNGMTEGNPGFVTNATSYPITYAMGQTWDPALMYRVSSEISSEIREKSPGLDTNLNFYSPTVNLSRDPRWGRNTESFGEDPVAAAKMAAQFINGFEGFEMDGKTTIDPNGYYKANATIKHYFANNSEFNRLQGVANMTEQESREYYSYVYREILKQAKPASVMAAYNRIQFADPAYSPFDEMPGGINHYTLDTMLRQTFGFKGYVTGDCNSANLPTQGSGTNGTSPTQGQNGYSGVGHGWRTPAFRWYG
ncbi:MAG: hypothetical protein LBU77_05590, partial [Clostridiales bacterium]|nr:hypothetical protein [Clostridiales bacterium]